MPTSHTRPASAFARWRKSSHSGADNNSCLEVADGYAPYIPVRDSKDPDGPALVFAVEAWAAFVAAVKTGQLPGGEA